MMAVMVMTTGMRRDSYIQDLQWYLFHPSVRLVGLYVFGIDHNLLDSVQRSGGAPISTCETSVQFIM